MAFKRSSGIILHPSSLPSPDGIGDFGPEAYRWIQFLVDTGFSLWQILPLGPTGYGDSPYQCFSAFAGNPYLISPTMLFEDGLLRRSDLSDRPPFSTQRVDYGDVIKWKLTILNRAITNFKKAVDPQLISELECFHQDHSLWLDDYALFMAIKEANQGVAWKDWDRAFRIRDPKALATFRAEHSETIQRHILQQFLFSKQWNALHAFSTQKGVQIIGDVPIFVAYDSTEAWSHPELFYLDKEGLPTVVAGVPPDYFSRTGQLWGNPLYRWDVHLKTGYSWWIQRIKASLDMVDIIRLDHFRGFAGYWEVPANMPTAEIGRWVAGPGESFFKTLREVLGGLPIIAEDLGRITPDVIHLRDQFDLPGMKVLQFAFSTAPNDPFLPHNYPVNCVAYTGTHDNDTSRGWFNTTPEAERDLCRRYLARSGDDISWDMIRAIWSSVAAVTLATMQDFLSLDSDARMNLPGVLGGNWSWRMPASVFEDQVLIERMTDLNHLYYRSPGIDDIPLQGHI